MKEYFKMKDVFDGVVHAKYQHKGVGNAVFEECGALLGDFVTLSHAEYAAHAINSHDELVAEVERLRYENSILRTKLENSERLNSELLSEQ